MSATRLRSLTSDINMKIFEQLSKYRAALIVPKKKVKPLFSLKRLEGPFLTGGTIESLVERNLNGNKAKEWLIFVFLSQLNVLFVYN